MSAPAPARSFGDAQSRRKSLLWTSAFCVLWAVIEILGFFAEVEPLQIVWTRYAVHLTALILISSPGKLSALVQTRTPVLQIGCSLMMLAMPLAFMAGAQTAGVREIEAVFWLCPLLAVLLARLSGERVHRFTWISVVLGWLGAAAIVRPAMGRLLLAIPGGLGMALSFALYLAGARRMAHETTRSKLFYTALFVFLPTSAMIPRFYRTPSAASAAIMIAIGLLGLLALFALDRSLELAPVSSVAPILFVQPLAFAAVHHAGYLTAFGVALILGALVLAAAAVLRYKQFGATFPRPR